MNHLDKTSYLTLALALLLDHNGKCSLAEALMLVPFSARVRRLAEQIIADRAATHGQFTPQGSPTKRVESPEANPPEEPGAIHPPCVEPSDSLDSSPDGVTEVVHEIKLLKVKLRCPGCGSHRSVALDANQMEHLRIRGHLEMPCGYCETPSLWEFSKESEEEPAEIFV